MASNQASVCDELRVRTCCKKHPITELKIVWHSVEAEHYAFERTDITICSLNTSTNSAIMAPLRISFKEILKRESSMEKKNFWTASPLLLNSKFWVLLWPVDQSIWLCAFHPVHTGISFSPPVMLNKGKAGKWTEGYFSAFLFSVQKKISPMSLRLQRIYGKAFRTHDPLMEKVALLV